MDAYKEEIAATAARMVVEEGLDYGAAKKRAAKQLGLSPRTALPDNEMLELAVEEYIAIFCAETQPADLRVLRQEALRWMQRLAVFRPHVCGAVWHGTATRNSDIYLQLFCDDPKSAEIALIDQGLRFSARQVPGFKGEMVDALSLDVRMEAWGLFIGVHLLVHDVGDLRGALLPDSRGRKPRGDEPAVMALLAAEGV